MAQVNIMSQNSHKDMPPPHNENRHHQPIPPAANFSGPFHHNLPPQTHYNVLSKLTDFSHEGAISAPAVPDSSDDYFSFLATNQDPHNDLFLPVQSNNTGNGNGSANTNTNTNADTNANANTYSQFRHYHGPENPKRHVKSKLSQSFTQEDSLPNSDNYQGNNNNTVDYNSQHGNQNGNQHVHRDYNDYNSSQHRQTQGQSNNQNSSSQRRNPGFRLNLDSVQPNSSWKVQNHQQTVTLPSSRPAPTSNTAQSSFEGNYDRLKISDPDMSFNQNGLDWDRGQESVTPLMNPPESTADGGYFGGYDDSTSYYDQDWSLPGGNIDTKPNDDFAEFSHPGAPDNNGEPRDDVQSGGFVPVPESFYIEEPRYGGTYNDNTQYQHYDQQQYNGGVDPFYHEQPQAYENNSGRYDDYLRYGGYAGKYNDTDYEQKFGQREQFQMPSPPHETGSLFDTLRRPGLEQLASLVSRASSNSGGYTSGGAGFAFNNDAGSSSNVSTVGSAIGAVMGAAGATRKTRRGPKVSICPICDRHISRDYSRHMRIHNEIGRFQCVFPRATCSHKLGKFNRPYDYKKHLLNVHFKFDDAKIKLAPNLTEKLHEHGACIGCGQRFMGQDWLDNHVLTADSSLRCGELQKHDVFDKKALLDDDGFRSE